MKKISKITQYLLLASIVVVVLDFARGDLWSKTSLLYLIWNLFLAWVPYVISLFYFKKETSIGRFIPIFIIWFLFFPNAPYLVTDITHIASRLPSTLWYDSLLFFLFAWIGLLLGMLSLFHLYQYIKKHFNFWISEIIIIAVCSVSSFGIYLGRFERWNSWDILVNPVELMKHSFYVSTNLVHTGTPLIFVLVFTIFMYLAYKVVSVLVSSSS
jgi:uncharacterized membrane protein